MTRAHTPRAVSKYEPQRTKTREVRAVNRCSVHFWSSRYSDTQDAYFFLDEISNVYRFDIHKNVYRFKHKDID